MIEFIFLISLFVIIFLLCFFMISNKQISQKVGGQLLIALSIFFVSFSLIFEPEDFIRWDLIEHFKLIDNMRHGGLHYVTTESQYADLYIYNYFAYFISLLPENYKNLLSAIPLLIDFIIVGYIYNQIFKVHLPNTNAKTRILSIFLWLCTFGLKLAISGIRCSLAISISALAIFLEMIQKKKRIFSILLYVIAIFIHNFAFVVILVRLLAMIKKPLLIVLSSLGISLALEPFARFVVDNANNEYLVFSFRRVLETIEDMGFSNALQEFSGSTLLVYMCFIALGVYLFIISTKAKQQYTEDGFCKNVVNFAATVGAVAIGLSFNYLYLERFMYLMSFAFLMITPLHNHTKSIIKQENILIVPMALFVFFFNDIYIYIVNYVGSYFLAF